MSGNRKSGNRQNIALTKYLDEKFKSLDTQLVEIRHAGKMSESQLHQLQSTVGKINVTLAHQEEQLEYHIKRTDLLEKELKPIRKWYDTIIRVGGVIAILATLIGGIAKICEWYLSFK